MHKQQSDKKLFTRNLLLDKRNSPIHKQSNDIDIDKYRSMKEKMQRSDTKMRLFGIIERAQKFAKMHPVVYQDGTKRMFKQIGLFPKAVQPHKMKLISLLWQAATIKGKIVPAKTSHLILILKELLDTLDTTLNRQNRIMDAMILICCHQVIVPPTLLSIKSLATNLVKQINLISGLTSNQSTKRILSPFKTSNYSTVTHKSAISPKSPFKKFVKQLSPSKSKPILSINRSNSSLKKSFSNLLKTKSPLFQLQIKINNVYNTIAVYQDQSSSDVVERLKVRYNLSTLMAHQIKQMIQEFIEQHRE